MAERTSGSGDRVSQASPKSSLGSDDFASQLSPPPPPPDFNPPVEFPYDSPAETIASPPVPGGSPSRFNSGSSSGAAIGSFFLPNIEYSPLRPTSPSIRRISSESVPTPGSGTSSLSSTEGGDHLQEMRERLVSEASTVTTPSFSRSRAGSASILEPGMATRQSSSNTDPGIANESVFDESAEDSYEGNQERPTQRRLSSGVLARLEGDAEMPAEHAWDSVWPAAVVVRHRNSTLAPSSDAGPSRFPTAPVSPFVTPSFSPSVVSNSTVSSAGRRPSSPSHDAYHRSSQDNTTSPTRFMGGQGSGSSSRWSPRLNEGLVSPTFGVSGEELKGDRRRRRSISSGEAAPLHAPNPSTGPVPIASSSTSRHGRSLSTSSSNTPSASGSTTPQTAAPQISASTLAAPANKGRTRGHSLSSVRNASSLSLPVESQARAPSPLAHLAHSSHPLHFNLSPRPSPRSSPRNSPRVAPMGSPPIERPKMNDISGSGQESSSLPPIALPPSIAPHIPPIDQSVHASPVHPRSPSPPLFLPLARPAVLRRAISDFDDGRKLRRGAGTLGGSGPPVLQRASSDTTEGVTEKVRRLTSELLSPGMDTSPLPAAGGSTSLGKESEGLAQKRKSPRRSPTVLPMLQVPQGNEGFEGVVESPITMNLQERAELERRKDQEGKEKLEQAIGEGTIEEHPEQKQEEEIYAQEKNPFDQWPGEPMEPDHVGDVSLMDEGDVLPSAEDIPQMDVTFDDEGLNTLERIFLLSKSEYSFHRAYVARVLGDLLNEVDPCESVEYVLPLLSGFSMDEDLSVRMAFAEELHRILWYFYSTCRLVEEEVDAEGYGQEADYAEEDWAAGYDSASPAKPCPASVASPHPISVPTSPPRKETVTVTSEGVSVVPTPTPAEAAKEAVVVEPKPPSRQASGSIAVNASAGPSSQGSDKQPQAGTPSSSEEEFGTPGSTLSEETAYSPGPIIKPYAEDDSGVSKDELGVLVDRPALQVGFFTPLIGSLLLSADPADKDFEIPTAVRSGVVALLSRLKGKGEQGGDLTVETWGQAALAEEADERRTFQTQTGPHQHDLRPFTREEKAMVERELLSGIIIGMGQLSTEMPADFDFTQSSEEGDLNPPDPEAFEAQLLHEATTGRATSVNLIGQVCEFYEEAEVVRHQFVDEVLRSWDGDATVRAEAAEAMSFLVKKVPAEQVSQMITLFEHFCGDENDYVRQSVCRVIPPLCKRIESIDDRRSFAVKAMETLTNTGVAPDSYFAPGSGGQDAYVRVAALEMLGEVIYIFHEDSRGPPRALLDIYRDDSEVARDDHEAEWDLITMFNFPGVCLTLGSDGWHEIRDLFHRLVDRAGDRVLRIVAAFLHELAKILTPTQVVQDILPVYTVLLACGEDIRERVFEHVDSIVGAVPIEYGWELFRNLAQAWKDETLGGWRAREKLALHLPSFLKTFQYWNGIGEVLEMMRSAFLDPFAAVRDAATLGIPAAYQVLNVEVHSQSAEKFRHILLDLGSSPSYRQRLTFVRCLGQFCKPPPNQAAFEEFFLPELPRLAKDVVDVRLGLARDIADLFNVGAYYESGSEIPDIIKQLAKGLSMDESADVRNLVMKVEVERLEKGKGAEGLHPAGKPENHEVDRASRPGDYVSPTASYNNPISDSKSPGSRMAPVSATATPDPRSNSPPMSARQGPTINIRRPTEDLSASKSSQSSLSSSYSMSSSADTMWSMPEDSNEETPRLSQYEWPARSPKSKDEDESSDGGVRMKKENDPFEASFSQVTEEPDDL
ncbi:hypothetical protein L202_00141 [Cryptococcus amylolentus CBS 6039]|uniref:Uncharacterized protein n=1 Tax=Cryptococcus amylolentus CBS 6039 TaxID=1295533 RepID=A0A1E3I6F1_9TREE|nr:hypothetical protein L202_00141 [Cryptococcus amylolentus CBS 6039]ODN84132.1 hypothetical protein L202_00141 [Cryptococcus amylolentus CBS 6039]